MYEYSIVPSKGVIIAGASRVMNGVAPNWAWEYNRVCNQRAKGGAVMNRNMNSIHLYHLLPYILHNTQFCSKREYKDMGKILHV